MVISYKPDRGDKTRFVYGSSATSSSDCRRLRARSMNRRKTLPVVAAAIPRGTWVQAFACAHGVGSYGPCAVAYLCCGGCPPSRLNGVLGGVDTESFVVNTHRHFDAGARLDDGDDWMGLERTLTMAVCPVPGLMEALVCPGFHVVEIRWIPCHGDDAVPFELYRGEPSELAVTTRAVVPDLEISRYSNAAGGPSPRAMEGTGRRWRPRKSTPLPPRAESGSIAAM
jgi:hypothetical protein